MTRTFRTAVVLEEDGKLKLDHLPFAKGDSVQVLVSPQQPSQRGDYVLRGTVLKFEAPTQPVAVEDWNANQ